MKATVGSIGLRARSLCKGGGLDDAGVLVCARTLHAERMRWVAPASSFRAALRKGVRDLASAYIAERIRHLLIVEDSALIALELEFTLNDLGIDRVTHAMSVGGALAALAQDDVDAALVDLMLNGEDGRIAIADLMARSIPFAIMTGLDDPDALSMQFPGVPVLIKPFVRADLISVLTEFC